MENLDISKLIHHHFIDYLFASEDFTYNQIKEGAYLNANTVTYRTTTNELLILQSTKVLEELQFYLWVVDLQFILETPKKDQPQKDYLVHLKKEYFTKLSIKFVSSDKKEYKYKSLSSYTEIPSDFYVNCKEDLIAFSTPTQIFIANLDSKIKVLPKKELEAREIKLNSATTHLDIIKWHPEIPTCLGILQENNFYVYDIENSIDTHEFHLSLSHKKKPKTTISLPQEDHSAFVDFVFCTQDNLEDFRFLTVFFLNTTGDIYYYCPIILPRMRIEISDFEARKEALEKSLKDEFKGYYEKLFECLKTISEVKDNQMTFRSIKNTSHETLSTKNSIQGYSPLSTNSN